MTKDKAMQQALEALSAELWTMLDKPVDEQYRVRYAYLLRVITALREALAQPPLPVQTQRPWVGLTEDEKFEIAEKLGLVSVEWLNLMQVIEDKLKKRNCE